MADLRELRSSDRHLLAGFRCRSFGEPWSALAEELVREHLADALEVGGTEALGVFTDDGTLTGVVAWTHPPKFPDLVQIPVLAVAIGHQRRGYGRALKTAVMDRARSEGSVGVISTVHEDNDAMNRLNNTLGGIAERDSTDHSYLVWIIDL